MKQIFPIAMLIVLFSCQTSSTKNEKVKMAQTNDSIVDMTINREAEPFVVINMNLDSVDSAGNKWVTAKLKNSKKQYYLTSGTDIRFHLGDTAMIGHNAAGEYMTTKNR